MRLFALLLIGVCVTSTLHAADMVSYSGYGITMNRPSDWKVKDVGNSVWISPADQKTATPALILMMTALPEDIKDLNVMTTEVMANLKSKYDPSGFEEPKDAKLGELDAKEILYKSPFGIKNVWFVAYHNGKMYQAWFQGKADKFDALLPQVREMLATYKVNT